MTAVHPPDKNSRQVVRVRLRARMPIHFYVAEVRKRSKYATKKRSVYIEARTSRSAKYKLAREGWEVIAVKPILRRWLKIDRHHRSAEQSLHSAASTMPFSYLLLRLVQLGYELGSRSTRTQARK